MEILDDIKNCSLCIDELPFQPKPILQFSTHSKILLIGQAPGKLAHESGIPWNDKSGERLRDWLKITPADFYDENKMAIVPMGFCYPGKNKKGDKPPRPECRARWLDSLVARMDQRELLILVGQHAAHYFLGNDTLENHIRRSIDDQHILVLPHPSPRNNIWLTKNNWVEREIIPQAKNRVQAILKTYLPD